MQISSIIIDGALHAKKGQLYVKGECDINRSSAVSLSKLTGLEIRSSMSYLCLFSMLW